MSILEWLAISMDSVYQMPEAPSVVAMTKIVCRHCQVCFVGGNHSN